MKYFVPPIVIPILLFIGGPLQDNNKLLEEKCRLGFASRMRSEESDEQSAEQL